MGKARVNITEALPLKVKKLLEENEEQIAYMIEREAESSTAFTDKTGKLRRGIKAESRVEGWVVRARAPHAHLVEFGHGGPNPAPAHPYLRPARDKVVAQVGARDDSGN